ncbi:MAG: LysR substrate-binding domain-containing protein [Actinomycetota bacterium]|nr:LysR substrate-binding domain-containing protein [Actinomycetota bacterium]
MTPGQLQTFVAVADSGSVREAAERLVVSQSAVSSVLATLQAELGVRLVQRNGRGLRLTEAGQVFARYGRRILGLWDEARVATVAKADPEHGRLRLAAVTTAGEHVVPPVLATFRRLHPNVEVTLEVGNRSRVWELITHGAADLGVGGRPPVGGQLASLASSDNELVVVSARSGDQRPTPRPVTEALLANHTWLVREPGSGMASTTDELLADLGIDPPRLTLGSNGAIRESVMVGLGIALVSRAAVSREIAEGDLEEWRSGPLPLRRRWHLVARIDPELPATAALFRDHVLGAEDTSWDRSPPPEADTGRNGDRRR